MKITRVISAIAIFYNLSSLAYGEALNYLKLSSLRNHHQLFDYEGGSTRIELNSSERFVDLYNALQEDETTDISEGVDSAFNSPYKSDIYTSQTVFYKDMLFGFEASDSIVTVVNNPVFPEINIFNVRTDSFYIQKKNKYQDYVFITRLSLMNRWYIDDTFSLEDIVTDSLDFDLKGGKTFTPLYIDASVERTIDRFILGAQLTALNLFKTDKYQYGRVNLQALYSVDSTFSVGSRFSPLYDGNYQPEDTLFFLGAAQYKFIKLIIEYSRLDKRLELDLSSRHYSVVFGGEKIHSSFDSELFTQNFYVNISLRY